MRKYLFFLTLIILLCVSINAQTDTENTSNNSDAKTAASETKTKRTVFRATKDQIHQAQIMLREKGTYSGGEDGKYDKDFRGAIKEFQEANGLKKSGSLNRATLEKMNIELTDKQREIPVNPGDFAGADDDKPKTRKKAFRPIKAQITDSPRQNSKVAGEYSGEADGKYNDDFRASLKTYQEANDLDKTGKLDEATLVKMEH